MEVLPEVKSDANRRRLFSWRILPLVALAGGAAAFFGFGFHEILSFEELRANRSDFMTWVAANTVLAAVSFIAAYAATVVFIPPSGTLMTVIGGFAFGTVFGLAYVMVGATLGATILFLVAKLALGDYLRDRAGPGIKKMEAGFRENELSYMLVLRLVPLFPFWLVNLAPAFLGVGVRSYVIGTFFGIIPGTAVYAAFGAGLGSILDSNEEFSPMGVLTPEIIAGLIGLALLALVPVVYKKIRSRPA
ncbi:MAG: TVP38/TMEM64 family protein [Rhodospirillales bacterium]|nr:TVP38/TMEM64 family protein [Rhodospirillales bacterium]